jgi:hypothetical protein
MIEVGMAMTMPHMMIHVVIRLAITVGLMRLVTKMLRVVMRYCTCNVLQYLSGLLLPLLRILTSFGRTVHLLDRSEFRFWVHR